MKAVCWFGKRDIRVETVDEPRLLNRSDAIIRVSSTAICGSDLHLYNGLIPNMEPGDILGHEFMGEVVEVGREVTKLKVGDRVVVPFCISCGRCYYCRHDLFSLCDNSNSNAYAANQLYGFSGAGLFGYSHLMGGYAGGQAEYVRVPFADVGPLRINSNLPDEKVLFLSDIFPTGYMAAENCNIRAGHIVAVWGCGPVGQFAIRSAYVLGAHKVIAIDRVPERLQLASEAGAVPLSADEDVLERLKELTGGRGPDACIDAVGMEAHGSTYDQIKQAARLETDRPNVLREAIMACRKGGTLSLPGVYGGLVDKIPFGAAFAKGLTFKMGQTHVQKYMPALLELIEQDKIDPSSIITHRIPLANAPDAYALFAARSNGCVKVLLKPQELPEAVPAGEVPAYAAPKGTAEEWETPRSKRLRETQAAHSPG